MHKATMIRSYAAVAVSALCLTLTGCKDDATGQSNSSVELKNYSKTPALVKMKDISGLEIFPLISSDDSLSGSPSYVFGGSADGIGLLHNSDGTFTMLVNNEDNFAVSRLSLDKTFKPVKGEYVVNSDGGRWRLCSATMATPEEHGFGPTYITCGESSEESMVHAINPYGAVGQSNPLPAFGHWSAENAVPLPKDAFSGKTVVVIGDDDSGPFGGQVAIYLSNTVGDLSGGGLYVMTRADNVMKETDMKVGGSYDIQFKKLDNSQSPTGSQINAMAADMKAIQFGRVEDIDYRKGAGRGREIYFNVTGLNTTGVNADGARTKYGRVYRMTLDQNDPTRGKLEVVLDGDDRAGIAKTFQDPDGICVTDNYVYIGEDPNGYGDETHDAYLYQYDIAAKALKVVFELDHHRGDAKYNVGGDGKFGSWEFGGMIDVSRQLGIPNTFALCIQPHTWTGDRYKGADGGTNRKAENQASQILIVKGLPR